MKREVYPGLGGLLETAVLRSAGRYMVVSLIGKGALSLPAACHAGYREGVLAWQKRAEHHVRQNVSYIPGLLTR